MEVSEETEVDGAAGEVEDAAFAEFSVVMGSALIPVGVPEAELSEQPERVRQMPVRRMSIVFFI